MRTLALLTFFAACTHKDDAHHDHTGHTGLVDETRTQSTASYTVSYLPDPDPIPFNDYFDVTVTLTDTAGAAVGDAEVLIDANMPHHGHGMNVTPTTTGDGAGHYTATGLLFHMEGVWELTVDITRSGATETARFEVDLGSGS